MSEDFLSTTLGLYRKWKGTGTVPIGGDNVTLDISPEPGEANLDEFVQFVRAYLRKNPIVSSSFTTGLTLFLADRQQLPLATNTSQELSGPTYQPNIDNNHGFC